MIFCISLTRFTNYLLACVKECVKKREGESAFYLSSVGVLVLLKQCLLIKLVFKSLSVNMSGGGYYVYERQSVCM